ncbi:MAG: site-specific integrase [Clostridia bacterium]|nr:site-specific integrase [Clostridia bacterium]
MPATAATVIAYLSELSHVAKVSTITRRATAISQAHQARGYQSPTQSLPVRALLSGIRKAKGIAQNGKAALLTDNIRAMVAALPASLKGIRDKAILLLGFAGAFRRSEIVALDVSDLTISREGITVLLQRSKTDQEGAGRKIGIPYGSNPDTCPVRALQDWLGASGITEGVLFRSVNKGGRLLANALNDKEVARIVKKAAELAGLNPDDYAGHSLRAGLATSAAMAGVEERVIMKQTGHKSVEMVRKYIRDGSLFRDNAAGQVGL